jgi:hypothetical protein
MPVPARILLLVQAFPIDPDKNQACQLQVILTQGLLSGIYAKLRTRLIGALES